jgi:hypothetical protein
MNGATVFRVEQPDVRCRHRAPITALGAVSRVAELAHQRDDRFAETADVETASARRIGEPVAGDGRADDVKRILRFSAVSRRVRQRADDLVELQDRAGPSVGDDERESVGVRRFLVDEVEPRLAQQRRQSCPVVIEGVEGRLPSAPVETRAPVVEQIGEHGSRKAVVPAGVVDLVGKSRALEPALQIAKRGVVEFDAKRLDHSGSLSGCGSAIHSPTE